MQTFEHALSKAAEDWLHKRIAKLTKENAGLKAELDHVKRELVETQKSSLDLIKQMKDALGINE
jgi:hypothetical protein